MDRLRQEFELIGLTEYFSLRRSELLSLMEVLRDDPGFIWPPDKKTTKNISELAFKGKLASLVKNVHGADPKRWAHRIEQRISKGDDSVTLLQRKAAKHALR